MDRHSTTEIGWDFIPPEKHYVSPKELKDSLNLYLSFGLEPWELAPGIIPPDDKFEVVRHSTSDGEKLYLWPTALTHSYLFRGQEQFHERCVPSLFRHKELTNKEIFINQVRLEEFKLMLQQYPQVRYFEDLGVVVDYKGLAQHYGIETDVLDLTSSIDVALFFAMCSYDKKSHEYYPKTDSTKQYIGYLYAYPYFFHMAFGNNHKRDVKLMPIGLQPFKRPGLQRGFSLHFNPNEQFIAPIYSFSYTAKDSQEIFSKLGHIFKEDNLARVTRGISESKTLTTDALAITCARHSFRIFGKRLSYNKARILLKESNISLTASPTWLLSKVQREELYNRFRTEEFDGFCRSLVQRKTISEGKESPYIDFDFICQQEFLGLFKKGCPSLKDYNSGVVLTKDNTGPVGLGFNYGRPQTIPNKETNRIDKWDNLSWEKYQLPNSGNRFSGDFPKMSLVKVSKDGSYTQHIFPD
ncbi:MAG: FRG domain-containing protein [Bacteroides sp.]|nr:FRG domain-containing protein [Bacteroides sp.]